MAGVQNQFGAVAETVVTAGYRLVVSRAVVGVAAHKRVALLVVADYTLADFDSGMPVHLQRKNWLAVHLSVKGYRSLPEPGKGLAVRHIAAAVALVGPRAEKAGLAADRHSQPAA